MLPLAFGAEGEPVVDLQRRLSEVGFLSDLDEPGRYGPATRAAVEAFQHRRGLRVDGVCGPETWNALVEAGFRLGDRFLYHRRPMQRGDDVAELQRRLSSLGFDTGRVDGIFGPLTARALVEFQGNLGLAVDGILGGTTLRELRRVTPRNPDPELVSAVRDRDRLRRAPPTLSGRLIAVGEEGGLDVLVTALRRRLAGSGAQAIPLVHRDASAQAAAANAAGVDAYVGLRLDPSHPRCVCAYYSGYQYESPGGRRLASLVADALAPRLPAPGAGPQGLFLPILRETRMPAVLCELGPASVVVEHADDVARLITTALERWAAAPLG